MNLHFNFLAPIYDRVIQIANPEKLKELLKLPQKGRLLDVGGGTGRVSQHFRHLVDQVIITDFSNPMLKQSQIKGNFVPIQAAAEALPFGDASFECIMVVDALHHFRNQSQAIREFIRVLKPGGQLVIEEPDIHLWLVKFVAWAEKLLLMQSYFHSAEEIQAMFKAQGIETRIERDDKFAAWIIAG